MVNQHTIIKHSILAFNPAFNSWVPAHVLGYPPMAKQRLAADLQARQDVRRADRRRPSLPGSVPGGLSFSAGEHVTYPAWDSVT